MYFNATNRVINIHKILDLYDLAYSKDRWYTSSDNWFQNKIKRFEMSAEDKDLAEQFITHLKKSESKQINNILFDEVATLYESNMVDDKEIINIIRQWKYDYDINEEFINCITKLYDIQVSLGDKNIEQSLRETMSEQNYIEHYKDVVLRKERDGVQLKPSEEAMLPLIKAGKKITIAGIELTEHLED